MLKAVLVDDEPLSLDALANALAKNENVEIVGMYTDPLEALQRIKAAKPEVVFLDIEMPELDGFSAAQEVINMGFNTHIVFATVFEQYALKAFEINAADYVVKPFFANRLELTIDRILKKLENNRNFQREINAFVKYKLARQTIGKIAVWWENSILLLDPETIVYFTMNEKKVNVHTERGSYESSSSLAELEERLENKGFFRCHKSFLVNSNYIEKIIPWFNSTYMIKIKQSPEQIPVSRLYAKKLKGMLRI